MKPFLLILSAPSGGGKTTITKALLAGRDDLGYSVSATTRARREGERDGVDYHFLSREEFLRRGKAGAFLESAEYSGNLYGTLKDEIEAILASGRHALLDIDVQGVRLLRRAYTGDIVSIFVLPPSAAVLVDRLGARATDDVAERRRRLMRARDELRDAPGYDYIVVNTDRTQAVAEVAAIIDAEGSRVSRIGDLRDALDELARGLEQAAGQLAQQH